MFFVVNNNFVKLAILKIASLTFWRNKNFEVQTGENNSYKIVRIEDKF